MLELLEEESLSVSVFNFSSSPLGDLEFAVTMDLTVMALGATPADERNYDVEGGGKRSRKVLAVQTPYPNVTHQTDSNPGLLP